jgi:hypothetical protein
MVYLAKILRCEHIKVNGVQCGSPAQKRSRFCFFHKRWHEVRIPIGQKPTEKAKVSFHLPVLEDANSIQMAIMQVMQLVLKDDIDPKSAGLLFYGLQTASSNLRKLETEPWPTKVVVDPSGVYNKSIGEDAWGANDFPELPEPEEVEEDTEEEDDDEEEGGGETEDDDDAQTAKGETVEDHEKPVDLAAIRAEIRDLVTPFLQSHLERARSHAALEAAVDVGST